jgi:hypothetical protein
MRKKLRVNLKTHLVCVPQDMVEDGMVGDVDSYPNAVTLTLVVPGANLRDVKSSLLRVVDDIQQRIDIAERKLPGKIKITPIKIPIPQKKEMSFDEIRAKIRRNQQK